MSEDVGTDPSFNERELTPVVHEPTDDAALYRLVRPEQSVPLSALDVPQAGAPQRVLDARVGEEVTQYELRSAEPVTQISVPPEVFDTDPEILEPTDPDGTPNLNRHERKTAPPKSRSSSARPRPSAAKRIRPFLLYSLPGLALGMAVSTWVLIDRSPSPAPATGVVAVAKQAPKAQAVATEELSEPDERPAPPPRTKRRIRPAGLPSAAQEPNQRAAKLDRLLRQAAINVQHGDYTAAYVRLHAALPLLAEPNRTGVRRCLARQEAELRMLGSHSARVGSCVQIARSP